MEIIILKNKGFTLIESLFSFSIYILCIISFISLYTLGRNQIVKTNHHYEEYIEKQIAKEKEICIENGLESILKDLR